MTRDAVLAHMLAVIDAFGTDRIEDEQIESSPGVFAVLGQARRERDRAMARIYGGSPPAESDFRAADALSLRAIRRERAMLLSARPVDMRVYETASLDKQCPGILASVALARAAGWTERRCRAVRATLGNVWLGLQIADDVVDWEDDVQRGGAWAVCLMRGLGPPSRLRAKESIRMQVLQSGILATMLARALKHMRSARRRATVLGAHRLAAWAGAQEIAARGPRLRGDAKRRICCACTRARRVGERGARLKRRHWDFGYEPSAASYREALSTRHLDAVVATERRRRRRDAPSRPRRSGRRRGNRDADRARAALLVSRPRRRAGSSRSGRRRARGRRHRRPLRRLGAGRGHGAGPCARSVTKAPVAEPTRWSVVRRSPRRWSFAEGHWFLGDDGGGVRVDRRVCGTGAGTRLAIIDDDAADLELVDLEEVVLVGMDRAPETSGHAALMAAWATSARRPDGTRFVGVAPDASPRLYVIPKPGATPCRCLSRSRAPCFDGADVVVCATYIEGTTSPMLDDALDVASHLGRGGRGSVVVLPTGRETSSAGGSLHASLSLEFGDPASDPRVHCVAPGGRRGGWFLWQSPRGRSVPSRIGDPPCDGSPPATTSRTHSRRRTASSTPSRAAPRPSRQASCSCSSASNPELKLPEVQAILERSVDAPERSAARRRRPRRPGRRPAVRVGP